MNKRAHTRLQGLPKRQRIKSQKLISALFKNGKTINHGILTLKYLELPKEEEMDLFGVTVPKRNFKKAVERNKIKRLIREVYRLDKPIQKETEIAYFILYRGKKMPTYDLLSKTWTKLLIKLNECL